VNAFGDARLAPHSTRRDARQHGAEEKSKQAELSDDRHGCHGR